jgi:orotidine-5'-phosphate decarboxylase
VDLASEAVRQAKNAVTAGLDGVVASSHEVGALRLELGVAPLLVVPGIRHRGEPRDDQHRVATPGEAVRAGATHLVVGRPILRAADPAVAWAEVEAEMH